MFLHSILIVGENPDSQKVKLSSVLKELGITQVENNPNILITTLDADKATIGIEKTRELQRWLTLKSTTPSPKIGIIEMAEALTQEAQNSLLKSLEEPPVNSFLILLARNADLLLPTILSRCQIIELSSDHIATFPKAEENQFSQVLSWIGEGNYQKGFDWAAENSSERKFAIQTIDNLLIVAHQSLLQGSTLQMASNQSKSARIVSQLFSTKKYLQANCNVRLTLENMFLN